MTTLKLRDIRRKYPWQTYPYAVTFEPKNTVPSDSQSGTLYYDNGANTTTGYASMRMRNGDSWLDIPFQKSGVVTAANISDGSNSFNMTTQQTRWTRTGNMVHFQMYLVWDSKGSTTGNLTIRNGLPYDAIDYGSGFFWSVIIQSDAVSLTPNYARMTGRIANNSGWVTFVQEEHGGGSSFSLVPASALDAAGEMYVAGSYITDVWWG